MRVEALAAKAAERQRLVDEGMARFVETKKAQLEAAKNGGKGAAGGTAGGVPRGMGAAVPEVPPAADEEEEAEAEPRPKAPPNPLVLLVEAMLISAMIMAAGMLLQRLLCSPRKGAASIVLPVTAAGKEN